MPRSGRRTFRPFLDPQRGNSNCWDSISGKPRHFPVGRALRGELALPEEEFRDFKVTQNDIVLPGKKFLKLRLRAGNFESRKRQVRTEGAIFRTKAQRGQCALNACRKLGKFRRRIKARPENLRSPGIREKTKTFCVNSEGFKTSDFVERLSSLLHLLVRDFTQELQGQVDPFGARPARIRGHGAKSGLFLGKPLAKFFRQLDGDKSSHKVRRSQWRKRRRSISRAN